MSRYIDADELLKKAIYPFIESDMKVVTVEDIKSAPTADVKPIVRAEWISHEEDDLAINDYQCSKCDYWTEYNTKYCPNCGARMKGEQTAEETNLTSEELFALDIEQNVKDIDSGEDDSYYRGRLAGMLSAYRILKGKPYEEKETDGESK